MKEIKSFIEKSWDNPNISQHTLFAVGDMAHSETPANMISIMQERIEMGHLSEEDVNFMEKIINMLLHDLCMDCYNKENKYMCQIDC